MRVINSIVIHHSEGNRHQSTESIREFHMKPESEGGRGFSDIGYHRVIEFDGSVHIGRHDSVVGAHAEGFNSNSLSVCIVGNFDLERMDENHPQFKALVQVLAMWCKKYNIGPEKIFGHVDVYGILGQKPKKTCPGRNLYAMIPRIRVLVSKYL